MLSGVFSRFCKSGRNQWHDRHYRLRRHLCVTGVPTLSAVLLLFAVLAAAVAWAGGPRLAATSVALDDPHLVVIKGKRLLHLFDGDRLIRSYPIDLGLDPAPDKVRRGDNRTPLGRFRVVSKNADSPYHRFLGIDYPHESAVKRGLDIGLISPGQAASIRASLQRGQRPDWRTELGGGIGIHGRRRGRDWTAGCVALDDDSIDELFDVLRVGDTVEVLP